MISRTSQLKDTLEALYRRYNRKAFIDSDPLKFTYRYSNPVDIEIAALLASGLAYGRVQQIKKSLNNLLSLMGDDLCAFVRNFGKKERAILSSFKHRFTTGQDICDLIEVLQHVIDGYGSVEKFFLQGYSPTDENIIPALSNFCDSLLDIHANAHNGHINKGLGYLLPRPAAGSACKRLNLFLRWMVRSDDVDLGLWKSVDKAKLIVPVDVHMARLCRLLGFYDRKTVSLATAVEITGGFAAIEPSDPVKYDFSLSRVGIVDNCTGQYRKTCESCELLSLCLNR